MSEKTTNQRNNHYIDELNHAWAHYRHLENGRTKYMNFFFTALFAVIGLYSAFVKIHQSNTVELELMTGFFLLIAFSIFTLYVFINISRIGWVLTGYSNVIKELRTKIHGSFPEKYTVRNYLPKSPKGIYSVQRSAEYLLKLSLILTLTLLISLIIFEWFSLSTANKVILIISTVFIGICDFYIILQEAKKKRLILKK